MNPKDKMAAMMAGFVQSEKDLRPASETEHRGTVLPFVHSGYNTAPDWQTGKRDPTNAKWGIPTLLGGDGWRVGGDILAGRGVTQNEIDSAAMDLSGAAMTGGVVAPRVGRVAAAQGKPDQPAAPQAPSMPYYHGNTGQGPAPGKADSFFWGTPNKELANKYAMDTDRFYNTKTPASPQVVPFETRFKNPMTVDAKGQMYDDISNPSVTSTPLGPSPLHVWNTDLIAQRAKDLGHDGLVINNVADNLVNPVRGAPRVAPDPQTTVVALQRGTVFDRNGDLLYANGKPAAGVSATLAQGRQLDKLGYYSAALEAAKAWPQGKGSPEQALAWLTKNGTKQAEIDATGLRNAFDGKPQVTRDDLVKYLGENRVGVNERQRNFAGLHPDGRRRDEEFSPRWSRHSLDPSNPTYRETVLNLPPKPLSDEGFNKWLSDTGRAIGDYKPSEIKTLRDQAAGEVLRDSRDVFRSGHFPEPNIVGHMMSSVNKMTRHAAELEAISREIKSIPVWGPEARAAEDRLYQLRRRAEDLKKDKATVYTLDQIQSDWGQKLRDGGVRDEAKIAELTRNASEAQTKAKEILEAYRASLPDGDRAKQSISDAQDRLTRLKGEGDPTGLEWATNWDRAKLLNAELRTANASVSGHPLVNTTDQWTNTTLRRGIQQAIEANADYMAIPSGKTVLGYNPGDDHGMRTFYDQIVPKNLANILAKLDKTGTNRQFVPQLETPSGMKGDGFSVFEITQAMREQARNGMPLFANGKPAAGVSAAIATGKQGAEAAYHGTNVPIDQFSLAHSGRNTQTTGDRPALWMTSGQNQASGYASGWGATTRDGANVIPLRVNSSKFDEWELGGGRLTDELKAQALAEAIKDKRPGVVFRQAIDGHRPVAAGGAASRNAPDVFAALQPGYVYNAITGELMFANGAPVASVPLAYNEDKWRR